MGWLKGSLFADVLSDFEDEHGCRYEDGGYLDSDGDWMILQHCGWLGAGFWGWAYEDFNRLWVLRVYKFRV